MFRFLFFISFLFNIFSADVPIQIKEDRIKGYLDHNWLDNNNNNLLVVEMQKETPDIDDSKATFVCETNFTHNAIDYYLKITIKENHNLEYEIKKVIGDGYVPIPEEDCKIFYKKVEINDVDKTEKIIKTPVSFLNSDNWILVKVETLDDNKTFYIFINNIYHIHYGSSDWMPFGYFSKFKKLKVIYSRIDILPHFIDTVAQTEYEEIDVSGLNFKKWAYMPNWFINARSLKTIKGLENIKGNMNMQGAFENCKELKNISLGENKILNMNCTFQGCNNLENVDISNATFKKDCYFSSMFEECKNLKQINGVEKMITKDSTGHTEQMFKNAKIGSLNIKDWGTMIRANNMFEGAQIDNLTIFNLKEMYKSLLEKVEKYKNDTIQEKEELETQLEELKKKEDTEENRQKINDIQNEINQREIRLEKLKEPKALDMFLKSNIKNFNITEGFLPEDKNALKTLLGEKFNFGQINIVNNEGNVINSFSNYKDFLDNYEHILESPGTPIEHHTGEPNQEIKVDSEEIDNIKEVSYCAHCCNCFNKCCCCCKSKT